MALTVLPVLVVIGATGGVGRWIVYHLLRDAGLLDPPGSVDPDSHQRLFNFHTRLVVRDIARAKAVFSDLRLPVEKLGELEFVQGDLTDLPSLEAALQGANFVVNAAGVRHAADGGFISPRGLSQKVEDGGMGLLVEAAKRAGSVKHVTLISSILVLRPSHTIAKMINLLTDGSLEWKLRGERHLRTSGLSYTIVRPGDLRTVGGFPDSPEDFVVSEAEKSDWESQSALLLNHVSQQKEGGLTSRPDPTWPRDFEQALLSKYLVDQGDRVTGFIPRREVAFVALMTPLLREELDHVTFELLNRPSPSNLPDLTFLRGPPNLGLGIGDQGLFAELVKESEAMPEWESDEAVSECRICKEAFWLLNQRHHCRNCGHIVCTKCSTRTLPLVNLGLPHPVRICDTCNSQRQ